jgi:hypothetical protein
MAPIGRDADRVAEKVDADEARLWRVLQDPGLDQRDGAMGGHRERGDLQGVAIRVVVVGQHVDQHRRADGRFGLVVDGDGRRIAVPVVQHVDVVLVT